MSRKYYAPAPEGSTSPTDCIVIKHGEQGYYPTAQVFTAEHCAKINELNGISPAEVEAAIICSMFDCWQNFERIAADYNPDVIASTTQLAKEPKA